MIRRVRTIAQLAGVMPNDPFMSRRTRDLFEQVYKANQTLSAADMHLILTAAGVPLASFNHFGKTKHHYTSHKDILSQTENEQ